METQNNIFLDLNSSKTVDDIKKLFLKYDIKRIDRIKYPYLEFSITSEEINELKKIGIITKENQFSQDLSKNIDLTPLEKILYSIIWKQGDLKKEKHIISGILGIDTERMVFNQFGKHLRDKYEPIIDQNVIRSYIYFTTGKIINDINEKHFKLYSNNYIDWIKKNDLFNSNQLIIDELLFSYGKKIKPKKKAQKKRYNRITHD